VVRLELGVAKSPPMSLYSPKADINSIRSERLAKGNMGDNIDAKMRGHRPLQAAASV
jgi:hypothetical protein